MEGLGSRVGLSCSYRYQSIHAVQDAFTQAARSAREPQPVR